MPDPWELLPGRSAEGHANNRINIALAAENGLLERSTLLTYEAIEFEPSLPASVLQFELIRDVLRKELAHAAAARGCFGNAQQPVMVIPNLYLYARCAPTHPISRVPTKTSWPIWLSSSAGRANFSCQHGCACS